MNYLKIDKEDVCNGEGLRVVLWLSGCSHKCKGCQNPQTWDANSGIPFDKSAKEELFRELDKDYISGLTLSGGDPLFESNLDGVLDLVTEINKRYNTPQDANEFRLSKPKKSIWLYTGYKWSDIINYKTPFNNVMTTHNSDILYDYHMWKRKSIISQCDVLVDGKYIESDRDISLKWCGSSNQKVISVKDSLISKNIVLLH